MNDIIDIIDLVILMWGVVLIYTALSARVTGRFNKYVLWDKKVPFEKCRHKNEFIKYVSPRMLVTGIEVLAFGIFGIVSSKYPDIYDKYYNWGLILTLLVFVWYSYFIYKANQKYY